MRKLSFSQNVISLKKGTILNMSKKNYLSGTLMLLLTAFLWGTTFIAQSDAMSTIGPFTFSAIRSAIGAAALLFIYLIVLLGRLFQNLQI